MPSLQIIGFLVFVIGLVPWTIGGMIHFRHEYRAYDKSLFLTWPQNVRTQQVPEQKALYWSMFTHPKSRWWCRIGFPISVTGMFLMLAGSFKLSELAIFLALAAIFFGATSFVPKRRR